MLAAAAKIDLGKGSELEFGFCAPHSDPGASHHSRAYQAARVVASRGFAKRVDHILREGAQRLLAQATEAEVAEWIDAQVMNGNWPPATERSVWKVLYSAIREQHCLVDKMTNVQDEFHKIGMATRRGAVPHRGRVSSHYAIWRAPSSLTGIPRSSRP